ncbi:MAG: isoprenylcysteine carboxylmethyltransferase family protein [Vicinamibacterales bacterium]
MEPGKKGRLLDQFERFLLTVLYVWLVYRVINAIDRADFTKVFVVQLPALLSEGLLLVFIWIRRSPTEITNSGLSWLIAFGATSVPFLLRPNPAGSWLPSAVPFVTPVYFAIFFLQLYSKLSLGRSFGVVPANRGVQSAGPYRWVRHPIYAAYLLHQLIFFFLIHLSWFNTGLFVVANVLQLYRLLLEEKLLSNDPEYVSYRQKVKYRLLPGVF